MNISSFPGYHGKILQIDLSKANISEKPLMPGVAEEYLGGRGMATRLFFDEIDPICDPLEADNVIVIATSPLIGTHAPTACRGHMVFKSPLTGIIGSPNCGGSWAHAFKSSGYDVLVIKGKSSEPVMIDISPEQVKIIPQAKLWGLDAHETTDRLTADPEKGKEYRILCIGPAGENLVRFSSVMNDKNRAYGRGGPGAVFGSKKLKAIRVSGRRKIFVKDEERYKSGLDQSQYLMRSAPITKRLMRELGTLGLIKLIDIIEMLPHRNFQDNLHRDDDLDKISGETLRKTILEKASACYGCSIACQRRTNVGGKKGEGPEYETVVMTGPNCGIYDLNAIARAHYRCNELGLDTISFGGTLACAMELSEKGYIPKKDWGQMNLSFGNGDILEKMVDLITARKGLGDILAEGSYRLAEHFQHPEYSMSIKKMEIPAYDPRASFTQALGYMTSPTGACHLRGGYAVSLAFFGGTKEIPRFSLLQSPIAIRNMQNLGIIQDSLGICRFTGFAFSTEPWARMASGITGRNFSTARMEEIANRIASLERIFNIKTGIGADEDTLPMRFQQESIIVGEKETRIPEETIVKMRKDYYQARGWDEQGVPRNLQ
ncbi:MAG: aldehyde ferredoxin oxidoreductase family protein [Candidatus Aminicenantes bacterium]|nr:MAG: aldehyde ferredoxin oxidoreductase family protein [Candidatus Aminicenantes bacterium]